MIVLFFSSVVRAATLSVCDTCTYTTISDAVGAASSGDTISLAADTYTEDVNVDKNLTIRGAGMGSTVLYDGGIVVGGGRVVTMSGLTVDTPAWAGIDASGASLSLSQVEFTDADPGVYFDAGAIVTVTDSVFHDNRQAFYLDGATLEVHDSTFTSNSTGSYGGAIDCYDAMVTITGSTFSGNVSESGGDAIRIGSRCAVAVTDTTFTSHAGYAIWAGYVLTLDRVTFASNEGAALYGYDGAAITITSSTFDGNGATSIVARGPFTVTESTFTSNEGGAITLFDGPTVIRGNRFLGNVETGYGSGAVYISSTESVEIDRNYFADNQGDLGGALAVFGDRGALSVTNNVVCGNQGREAGGFWLAYGSGSFTVTNNVFVENTGYTGGGIYYDGTSATSTFVNNTLLGNSATDEGGSAYLGSDFIWVNNIVAFTASGNGVSGGSTASSTATLRYGDWHLNTASDLGLGLALSALDTTNISVDPLLSSWSADGDCTNDRFWLGSASPAIDAGDPSYTDPDGSRSDIGACGGPGAACNDADGDGYMVVVDCDDDDASVYPGAPEGCDGLDHDCDGSTWGRSWYADSDGDGYGDASSSVTACEAPTGYTSDSADCDDLDPHIHPGAGEVWYDGVDQDCRGGDDYDQDGDGEASDGFGGTDCDDLDPDVNAAAEDVPDDGIDGDCNGVDEVTPGDTDAPDDDTDAPDDAETDSSPDPEGQARACDCSATPAPGGLLLALAALLAARRRELPRP